MTNPLGITHRPDARRARLVVTAMLIALIALASGLMSATTAAAHGGPFELHVSSDGAGGIAVYATYTEDGHIVTEIMNPVAEATRADGDRVEPVALISSPEGEGRWVSEEPFLGNGDWTVTVTVTEPGEATATVEFTVAPLEAPIEPKPIEPKSSASSSASPATTADQGGFAIPVGAIIAIVAGLVAVAVLTVVLVMRRNRAGS